MAPISARFVMTRPHDLLLLAQTAKTWKCRPSQILRSSISDFQIDLACAEKLWLWEAEQIGKSNRSENDLWI